MPDTWSIAIYRGPSPLALAPIGATITAADVTDVDAGSVADPFLVRRGGRWFLFFEVIPRANHRGGVLTNRHHIDAHRLEGGSWIAAVDHKGDGFTRRRGEAERSAPPRAPRETVP